MEMNGSAGQADIDRGFMAHALELAHCAQAAAEVPVGAVVVLGDEIIGRGYNQPIHLCDPGAHAEMLAIRAAGSALNLLESPFSNHRCAVIAGVEAGRCGELLTEFFAARRV